MNTTGGKVYTTWGPVRGGCGRVYASIEEAGRAVRQDQRDVRRGHPGGGYSDREVRVVDSAEQATRYDVTRGPGRRVVDEEPES